MQGHKALVWICEALYEALRAGFSEREASQRPAAAVAERPLCFCSEFTGIQVGPAQPGAHVEKQSGSINGLRYRPVPGQAVAGGADRSCPIPFPCAVRSANHRGLNQLGARPAEKGLRLGWQPNAKPDQGDWGRDRPSLWEKGTKPPAKQAGWGGQRGRRAGRQAGSGWGCNSCRAQGWTWNPADPMGLHEPDARSGSFKSQQSS